MLHILWKQESMRLHSLNWSYLVSYIFTSEWDLGYCIILTRIVFIQISKKHRKKLISNNRNMSLPRRADCTLRRSSSASSALTHFNVNRIDQVTLNPPILDDSWRRATTTVGKRYNLPLFFLFLLLLLPTKLFSAFLVILRFISKTNGRTFLSWVEPAFGSTTKSFNFFLVRLNFVCVFVWMQSRTCWLDIRIFGSLWSQLREWITKQTVKNGQDHPHNNNNNNNVSQSTNTHTHFYPMKRVNHGIEAGTCAQSDCRFVVRDLPDWTTAQVQTRCDCN